MAGEKQSYKLLACEVACREIGICLARSPLLIDLDFLPVGHHDHPQQGHVDLQTRINAVAPGRYDAILIGYGLCNLILEGLTTAHTPLVIPRAHDCITFFLGSKERYQDVFHAYPGAYFFTAGWLDFPFRKARANGRRLTTGEMAEQKSTFALEQTYAELVEKYGEDNARYLVEVTESWTATYQRGLYIRFEHDTVLGLRGQVAAICQNRGWAMAELPGDLSLLQHWLDGIWTDDKFLIVRPGETVVAAHDSEVIKVERAFGADAKPGRAR